MSFYNQDCWKYQKFILIKVRKHIYFLFNLITVVFNRNYNYYVRNAQIINK